MTFDPVEHAKRAGIWPKFRDESGKYIPVMHPKGFEITGREAALERIKLLKVNYEKWATGPDGVIDDPGEVPDPIEKPVEIPAPTAPPEEFAKLRSIIDPWIDNTYITEYLPATELWSVANDLWIEKQAEQRARALETKPSAWTTKLLRVAVASVAALAIPIGLCVPLVYADVMSPWTGGIVGGFGSLAGILALDAIINTVARKTSGK